MNKDPLSFKRAIFYDLKRWYIYNDNGIPKNKIKFMLAIVKYCLISKGFRSIFFYRLNSLKFRNHSILRCLTYVIIYIFCIHIPYTAKIGEGFYIGHTECVVINPLSILGKNITIMQGVTIGGNMGKFKDGRQAPFIEDNVFIGAGAKVLGPVKVGKNSIIGANAVVLKDVPKDSLAAGVPAKTIKKIELSYIEIQKKLKPSRVNKNYI